MFSPAKSKKSRPRLAITVSGIALLVTVVATWSAVQDIQNSESADNQVKIAEGDDLGGLRVVAEDPELMTLYRGCPMSGTVPLGSALEEHWEKESKLGTLPNRLPEVGGGGGTARIGNQAVTAIRLVSADSQEWLISPDDWYSEEERAQLDRPEPDVDSRAVEPLPSSKPDGEIPTGSGAPLRSLPLQSETVAAETIPEAPQPPQPQPPQPTNLPVVAPAREQAKMTPPVESGRPKPETATSGKMTVGSAVGPDSTGEWLVEPEGWYSAGDRAALEAIDSQSTAAPPRSEGTDSGIRDPAATESAPPVASEIAIPPETPLHETPPPSGTTPERRDEPNRRSPSDELVAEEIPAPIQPKAGQPNALQPNAPEPAVESGNEPDLSLFGDSAPDLGAPQRERALAADHGNKPSGKSKQSHVDPHLELLAKNCYPSARECAKCHKKHYEEWSISSHAYANISPMFQKFEQRLTELSQGTVGYFCYRCHSPVLTQMGLSRTAPLGELPQVVSEGVTCIACHRVQVRYGRSNGDRRIETGSIFAPVLGNVGGTGVHEAISKKSKYKVKTSPGEKGPGQDIHTEGFYFDQLSKSEFCATCHQVAVHPGIKLEVVYEQYRASPACKKGIECQHCHMGRIPGLPSGFEYGPIAEMTGEPVHLHRKKSNHVFYGPHYSIAHPGIYPFHLKGDRWTHQEWLQFDWRAGWGTEEFEKRVENGYVQIGFPPVWQDADDRRDAREIVDDNLAKIAKKREIRKEVMENGSKIDGPFFDTPPRIGKDLKFHMIVTNTNSGHNLLTASLGAQPQLWMNIAVIAPDGRRVWETGYMDSYGDVCDIHSADVRAGKIPFDWQLFNLQTMFLITGAKGTDRELPLPVNIDFDQLPFLRPGAIPISTTNHPPFIRMESRSLAALGSKHVKYKVDGKLLCQPGTYRMAIRMRNRIEPMYFMRFCNATVEMQRLMMERMLDVHEYSIEFNVR